MEKAKRKESTWSAYGVTQMGDEVQVRVTFKGDMAKKFKAVKDHLGLPHNTDVVRVELKKAYDRLPEEAKEKE